MTDPTDVLTRLAAAVAERVREVRGSVAAIELSDERHVSGTLWRAGVVVTSEQSLPRRDEFRIALAGGASVTARVAGRDPGTNLAALRIPEQTPFAVPPAGDTETGAIALALGADLTGEATARLGIVNHAGPEWHSLAGGRIDRRIVLDIRLGRAEEGGPVYDLAGRRLGMSAFAPRGGVLVIPAATIDRIIPILLEDGRVARGWLGLALQPVAVPEQLQGEAGEGSGLMVMSIAEGSPAAKGGVVAGDIVLSVNGTPARRLRKIASHLGSESIGRNADLEVIRAGSVVSLRVTIEARPPA
jgi:S1-C subfamily serine protease